MAPPIIRRYTPAVYFLFLGIIAFAVFLVFWASSRQSRVANATPTIRQEGMTIPDRRVLIPPVVTQAKPVPTPMATVTQPPPPPPTLRLCEGLCQQRKIAQERYWAAVHMPLGPQGGPDIGSNYQELPQVAPQVAWNPNSIRRPSLDFLRR